MNLDKMKIINENEAPTRHGNTKHNYAAIMSKCADLERGQVLQIPECNSADRTNLDRKIKEAFKNLKFDVWGRKIDGEYRVFVMLKDA